MRSTPTLNAVLIALLLNPISSYAQNVLLPLFENTSNGEAVAPVSVSRFRVLIFPHLGAYSTPQGRESDASSVKITSVDGCDVYTAKLDSNQEWVKEGIVQNRVTDITLNAKTLTPTYFECQSQFIVHRAAPLKSFNYPGDFVAISTSKGVQIINILDSNTYIKGVVPSEVEVTWPMETLKAQAVAARTYAWWSVVNSRKKSANYDMDDTVMYQAYLGNYKRGATTDTATDQTQGLVLKYNDAIIKSYFSADSGGYTEDSKSVFLEDLGYCQANPEKYDVTKTQTAWTKTFKLADLQATLIKAKLLPAGLVIAKISVDSKQRTSSGRVANLSVVGTNGKTYLVKGTDFRYSTGIRSTFFDLQTNGTQAFLNGKGYGHGVGMAQVGALEYARQLNWTFDQILNFYYTGTTLTHE